MCYRGGASLLCVIGEEHVDGASMFLVATLQGHLWSNVCSKFS